MMQDKGRTSSAPQGMQGANTTLQGNTRRE